MKQLDFNSTWQNDFFQIMIKNCYVWTGNQLLKKQIFVICMVQEGLILHDFVSTHQTLPELFAQGTIHHDMEMRDPRL